MTCRGGGNILDASYLTLPRGIGSRGNGSIERMTRKCTPRPEELADLNSEQAGQAATLLRALANPTRLMLLCSLVEGEHSVGELNERIPMSQSALSQHLARLREEKLVATRRQSQTIFYRIADPMVLELIAPLHRRYCSPGEPLGEH